MSEFDLTEDVELLDVESEEEYEPADHGALSPDTGTSYDEEGEAETTPHDEEYDEESDEDEE